MSAGHMLLRAFIALEIPAGIQSAIAHSTAALKNALPKTLVRWVAPQNVHLTLKFLGDASLTTLEQLAERLKGETASHGMFSISVGGLGAFPTPRRARVIWIGIQAPAAFENLQRSIEFAAARLGYEPETRPFSPHLTIGRVRQPVRASDQQQVRAALEQTPVGALGAAEISAVHLFKSDLQPTSSIYTRLFSAPLKS